MKTTVPEVLDLLPDDARFAWVEEKIRASSVPMVGEIRTPIFEHRAVSERNRETTDIVEKEMYTMLDKADAVLLCARKEPPR